MTPGWHAWLPEDACVPTGAQRSLADQIEGWARDWFPGAPRCEVGNFARIAAPGPVPRKETWHGCEGVSIGLSPTGQAGLGALVLDLSSAGARSQNDLALLEALGAECLDGLKLRLAQLFGLGKPVWRKGDPAQAGAVHRLEIVLGARAVTLQLDLSAHRFSRFVLAALPEPARREPLAEGADALAGIPLSLSALLGRCSLTLAELSGLAPGDVLVLDGGIQNSVPLALAGLPLTRGRCTIVEAEGLPALKIAQAPAR